MPQGSDPYAEFQKPRQARTPAPRQDPYAEFQQPLTTPPLTDSLLESRRAVSRSEFEANQPPSTILTRARELGIGALEPLALQNLIPGAAATVKRGVPAALTGNARELLNMAGEALTGAVEPVGTFAQGVLEGDPDKAAYGAGGILSRTVPAVSAAAEVPGVKPAVRTAAPVALRYGLKTARRYGGPTAAAIEFYRLLRELRGR
jgi:hypothetical protein